MAILSVVVGVALLLSAFVGLSMLGLLPDQFLSLFALINHSLRKKARFKETRKRKFNFSQVDKGLFVGTQPRVQADLADLRLNFGITAIVSLNEEHELYIPGRSGVYNTLTSTDFDENSPVIGQLEDSNFLRLHLPVPDYQGPTVEALVTAVKFIESQIANGGKVFVHCNGGKGRSVAVVLAYLMAKKRNSSFEELIQEVKSKRKQTSSSVTRYPFTSQARNLRKFQKMNESGGVFDKFYQHEAASSADLSRINMGEVLFSPPSVATNMDLRSRHNALLAHPQI